MKLSDYSLDQERGKRWLAIVLILCAQALLLPQAEAVNKDPCSVDLNIPDFLCVNKNDDDKNDEWDLDDTPISVGDPDLKQGGIAISVSDTFNGTVTVTFEKGGNTVGSRAWIDQTKEEAHPLTWTITDGELDTEPPVTFYLEGIENSLNFDDLEMKAVLSGDDDNGPCKAEDEEKSTVLEVDADVDSKNDSSLEFSFTDEEDKIENSESQNDDSEDQYPGKVIFTNAADGDDDGVPDYADGYSFNDEDDRTTSFDGSRKFVPLQIKLIKPYTIDGAKIKFGYPDEADPIKGITKEGDGSVEEPWKYLLENEGLRIWKKDAPDRESGEHVPSGDFIPADQDLSWSDIAEGRVAELYIEYVGAVSLPEGKRTITVEITEEDKRCEDKVDVHLAPFDVDLDSDNNNGHDDPERSLVEEASETVDPDDPNPRMAGKVFMVPNADSDGDDVPDLADGLTKFESDGFDPDASAAADGAVNAAHLIPVKIQLGELLLEDSKIRFDYEESDPDAITKNSSGDAEHYELPESGLVRLWLKDVDGVKEPGDEPGVYRRNVSPITSGGDFIPSDEELTPNQLGFEEGDTEVTIYAEVVKPTEVIGEIEIKVESKYRDQEWIEVENIDLTSFATQIRLVGDEGGGMPLLDGAPTSHPNPVLDFNSVQVTNLRVDPQNKFQLLADISVSGTIRSNVCDLIPPGHTGATITDVEINFNGFEEGIISVNVDKKADSFSFQRPFPFDGTFSKNFTGIRVSEGTNRLLGYAKEDAYHTHTVGEISFEVEVEFPENGPDGSSTIAQDCLISSAPPTTGDAYIYAELRLPGNVLPDGYIVPVDTVYLEVSSHTLLGLNYSGAIPVSGEGIKQGEVVLDDSTVLQVVTSQFNIGEQTTNDGESYLLVQKDGNFTQVDLNPKGGLLVSDAAMSVQTSRYQFNQASVSGSINTDPSSLGGPFEVHYPDSLEGVSAIGLPQGPAVPDINLGISSANRAEGSGSLISHRDQIGFDVSIPVSAENADRFSLAGFSEIQFLVKPGSLDVGTTLLEGISAQGTAYRLVATNGDLVFELDHYGHRPSDLQNPDPNNVVPDQLTTDISLSAVFQEDVWSKVIVRTRPTSDDFQTDGSISVDVITGDTTHSETFNHRYQLSGDGLSQVNVTHDFYGWIDDLRFSEIVPVSPDTFLHASQAPDLCGLAVTSGVFVQMVSDQSDVTLSGQPTQLPVGSYYVLISSGGTTQGLILMPGVPVTSDSLTYELNVNGGLAELVIIGSTGDIPRYVYLIRGEEGFEVFTGSDLRACRTRVEYHLENGFADAQIHLGSLEIETAHGEGHMDRFVVRVAGPDELLEEMEEVTVPSGKAFKIRKFQDDGKFYLSNPVDGQENVPMVSVSLPQKPFEAAPSLDRYTVLQGYQDLLDQADAEGQYEEIEIDPGYDEGTMDQILANLDPDMSANFDHSALLEKITQFSAQQYSDVMDAKFYKGFLRGMGGSAKANVTDIWGFVKGVAKLSWKLSPSGIIYKMSFGDRYQSEYAAVTNTAGKIISIGKAIDRATPKIIRFLVTVTKEATTPGYLTSLYRGDFDGAKEMGPQLTAVVQFAGLILFTALDEWSAVPADDRGYWFGYICTELLIQVGVAVLSSGSGLAVTGRSLVLRMGRMVGALQNNAKLAVVPIWGAVITKLKGLFIAKKKTTRSCFVAGTMVLTMGGLQAIETIETGDIVWAQHEVTGIKGWKAVNETIQTENTEIFEITVDGETIRTTGEHPFYIGTLTDGRFKPARDLRLGDYVLDHSGRSRPINQIYRRLLDRPVPTYNLSVDDFKTYFVGQRGLWVHNQAGECAQLYGFMLSLARELTGSQTYVIPPNKRFEFLKRAIDQIRPRLSKLARQRSSRVHGKIIVRDAAQGTLDVDDVPSYNDWNSILKGKKGNLFGNKDENIEIHHIVPQAFGKLRGFKVNSQLPSLPLHRVEHKIISDNMNPWLNPNTSKGQIFSGLDVDEQHSLIIQIYERMDGGVNSRFGDMASVTRAFGGRNGYTDLGAQGLPPEVQMLLNTQFGQ